MNKNKKAGIRKDGDEVILVRLSPNTKRELEAASRAAGESMNTLVRMALRRWLDIYGGKGGL